MGRWWRWVSSRQRWRRQRNVLFDFDSELNSNLKIKPGTHYLNSVKQYSSTLLVSFYGLHWWPNAFIDCGEPQRYIALFMMIAIWHFVSSCYSFKAKLLITPLGIQTSQMILSSLVLQRSFPVSTRFNRFLIWKILCDLLSHWKPWQPKFSCFRIEKYINFKSRSVWRNAASFDETFIYIMLFTIDDTVARVNQEQLVHTNILFEYGLWINIF